MLDENLPTFYTKPSSDNPLTSTIFLSQHGSELQPEYTLRRPDPNIPASKNCYAVALYDSYNPEILYAEVLVQPEWTQPTLSQAEIRAQNGSPVAPVPIVPDKFTIQLYNPDQQVIIRQIAGSWNSSAHWEFDMPQNTFRQPSASSLDRSQNDPAASDVTPKIAFKWKRDGKLSKDISCYLSGKSTEGRKNKEPDITVAMYKGGKDLTIYQPNMHRVDVEDAKGLEVVLLLGAAVIKDIFFNPNREMFNIGTPTAVPARRKNSGPVIATGKTYQPPPPTMSGAVYSTSPNRVPTSQIPPPQSAVRPQTVANSRTQVDIDAETARKLQEREDKEREKRDREEQKKIKKMLDAEDKERKRREAEVAKETERLQRIYGVPSASNSNTAPPMPPRPQSQQFYPPPPPPPQVHWQAPPQQQFSQYQSAPHSRPVPVQRPLSTPTGTNNPPHATLNTWLQRPQQSGPYLQAPGQGTATSSGFFGLGGNKVTKKRSVFF